MSNAGRTEKEPGAVEQSAQVIAASLALTAYAIALVSGIASGNPGSIVMVKGLLVLVGAYIVGLGVGACAEQVVREHLDDHRRTNPVPDLKTLEREASAAHSGDAA